jgi:hypothetical protein
MDLNIAAELIKKRVDQKELGSPFLLYSLSLFWGDQKYHFDTSGMETTSYVN